METKNELILKEIVAATAAEPEDSVNWGVKVADYSITTISLEQKCLLCDNTRVLPAYMSNIGTYVCDECREAMAYIKEVKKWRGDSLLHG
ncbi:MAG: hypothetical protein J6A25_00700 [Lachnospiraceae bacterium]|nr:hypothetical protein [Lachnospiraceae bacterium]